MQLLRHPAPEYVVEVDDPRLPATTQQEQRYEELYRMLFPRLIAYARHWVSRDEADDAVHAALTGIWWRWARIAPEVERSPASFFFRAVRQQLAKIKRRERRTELFVAGGERERVGVSQWSARVAAPEAELERDEIAAVIEATVATMPDRPRAAWMLVRESELTYAEAAQSLDIAPVSIKQLITRAQQRLRAALAEAGYRLSTRILPRRPRRSRKLLLPKSTEGAVHD